MRNEQSFLKLFIEGHVPSAPGVSLRLQVFLWRRSASEKLQAAATLRPARSPSEAPPNRPPAQHGQKTTSQRHRPPRESRQPATPQKEAPRVARQNDAVWRGGNNSCFWYSYSIQLQLIEIMCKFAHIYKASTILYVFRTASQV